MLKIISLTLVFTATTLPLSTAFAQDAAPTGHPANRRFIGIDQDNGNIYYNGRNSGRYCVYRTVQHFNRMTGYMEDRRIRHCGRGMYVD